MAAGLQKLLSRSCTVSQYHLEILQKALYIQFIYMGVPIWRRNHMQAILAAKRGHIMIAFHVKNQLG